MTLSARARTFDAWAAEYDRYRPGYPGELFETIAERLRLPEPPDVIDVGAGTGRASIAMAGRGWRVTAVEPGGPMLDALRAAAARAGMDVTTRQATAEQTGLPDACADLVTAAQAFHFFDHARALIEMARVLRPAGGIALFWNVRDDDASPFLREYTALLIRYLPDMQHLEGPLSRDEVDTRREVEASGLFEPNDRIELHHRVRMDAAHFVGMAFTSSYVRVGMERVAQDRFRGELQALIAAHHGSQPFDVPYQVDLWTARRKDR